MKGMNSYPLWGIILMVSGNPLLSCINLSNGMRDAFCLCSFCAAQMVPGPPTKSTYIWAIYSDLSRGHPKWWFSKGIPPKMALN